MSTAMKTALMLLSLGALAGCEDLALGQGEPIPPSKAAQRPSQEAEYMRDIAVTAERESETSTAVESALMWSQKCSELSETVVRLQEEKHDAEEENRKLMTKVATLQAELERTQTELADANEMLMQMREELGKWKTDVLGFRDEMRRAEMSQINALRKIMELLGGEPAPFASYPEPTTQPSQTSASETRGNDRAGNT